MSIANYKKLLTIFKPTLKVTETEFTMRTLTVLDALKDRRIVPSDRQFALRIGIDPTQISNARRGVREIPSKYIDKIVNTFGVNRVFLDAGVGEMFTRIGEESLQVINANEKNDKNISYTDKPPHGFNNVHEPETPYHRTPLEAKVINQDIVQVPIVEKRAKAGYILGHSDPEYIESLRKVFIPKQYEKGNYLVFEIDGPSMDDGSKRSICNGDAVLCKELDTVFWKEKLFKDRLFIIVTENDVLCKQVINHNVQTGDITCHSFNPAYQDFNLNLKDVYQLFYLVRIVERDINY